MLILNCTAISNVFFDYFFSSLECFTIATVQSPNVTVVGTMIVGFFFLLLLPEYYRLLSPPSMFFHQLNNFTIRNLNRNYGELTYEMSNSTKKKIFGHVHHFCSLFLLFLGLCALCSQHFVVFFLLSHILFFVVFFLSCVAFIASCFCGHSQLCICVFVCMILICFLCHTVNLHYTLEPTNMNDISHFNHSNNNNKHQQQQQKYCNKMLLDMQRM